jgi:hypothetical protein
VYKVLRQTVPEAAKNDALREMEAYLSAMLRQVDSSLLEEWERLRNPTTATAPAAAPELRPPGAEAAANDITRDPRRFTALVRAAVFPFIAAIARDDLEEAIAALGNPISPHGAPWTPATLKPALEAYYAAGHERILLDPEARNAKHTHVVPDDPGREWRVEQVLVDPDGFDDWVAEFRVDLAASRASGTPALRLEAIRPVGI